MMFLKLLSFLLPWFLRRRFLNYFFQFEIHPSAKIGYAWIFPKKLIMGAGSRIDHFTVAIHLDTILLKEKATIGRSNWITGFPTGVSKHFQHQTNRKAELIIDYSTAITKHHHIDCTNSIQIGKFTTIAGYQSQLLTHSINLAENRQDSAPINIGDYCFVGTNVTILGGSSLPNYSILGAKSLLNKQQQSDWTLYGGIPAIPIKSIPKDWKYFQREDGFVY